MASDSNVEMVRRVAVRLGLLRERVVFVGGATVGLLITDTALTAPRSTKDVDVFVEVGSTLDYTLGLADDLRSLGFREDSSTGAPLCRWLIEDLFLDVMPTHPTVLGFSNRWYETALKTAVDHPLSADLAVRLITAPCFLATKLEAFAGRGGGDFQASHDLEDLIAVVDGRPTLADEVGAVAPELRTYLARRIGELLAEPAFLEAIRGHLAPDAASQARARLVRRRLQALSALVS